MDEDEFEIDVIYSSGREISTVVSGRDLADDLRQWIKSGIEEITIRPFTDDDEDDQ